MHSEEVIDCSDVCGCWRQLMLKPFGVFLCLFFPQVSSTALSSSLVEFTLQDRFVWSFIDLVFIIRF